MKIKMSNIWIIIAVIIIAGSYCLYKSAPKLSELFSTTAYDTYTNNELGFSFDHPNIYVTSEISMEYEGLGQVYYLSINNKKNSDSVFHISILNIIPNRQMPHDKDPLISPHGRDTDSTLTKSITIGEQPGKSYGANVYVAANNNYRYAFGLSNTELETKNIELENIVKSFKFLN